MTTGSPFREDELVSGASTARDSLTVAVWTAVSRATGVVRVVVIGAVLGPTFFGNAYQLTNVVPNLLFYGFLAGSLLSSLLVPGLVAHIDSGNWRDTARVAGGFLGVEWLALLAACPLAVLLVPLLVGAFSGDGGGGGGQHVPLLLVLAVPQVFCYAVVASATAVMYARRRYLLAAAAPAVENLAVIAVLLLAGALYDTAGPGPVPVGLVLLLGIGSTLAVVGHALVQWWGAHRCGVTLLPRPGWRDPEVRTVVRRAFRSVAQSGLLAAQLLLLLAVAGRVAGGTVAFQIALNFYHLPLALVAAPVGLALLPRLSRLLEREQATAFTDSYLRALTLALFLVVPAAAGYVVLAGPLAHSVAAGRMGSEAGVTMVAVSLGALALGLVGETVFVISTQAAYARGDAGRPLRSMLLQTGVCLVLLVPALLVHGREVVALLGAAFAVASAVGGVHLALRVRQQTAPSAERLWPSLLRIAGATVAMAVVVRLVTVGVTDRVDGRVGWVTAVVAGAAAGMLVYALVHRLLRSPELGWVLAGARGRGAAAPEEVGST